MRFESPLALLALLLVPGALAGHVLLQRRRMRYAIRFTNLEVLEGVVARSTPWRSRLTSRCSRRRSAVLCVAAARPTVTTVDATRARRSCSSSTPRARWRRPTLCRRGSLRRRRRSTASSTGCRDPSASGSSPSRTSRGARSAHHRSPAGTGRRRPAHARRRNRDRRLARAGRPARPPGRPHAPGRPRRSCSSPTVADAGPLTPLGGRAPRPPREHARVHDRARHRQRDDRAAHDRRAQADLDRTARPATPWRGSRRRRSAASSTRRPPAGWRRSTATSAPPWSPSTAGRADGRLPRRRPRPVHGRRATGQRLAPAPALSLGSSAVPRVRVASRGRCGPPVRARERAAVDAEVACRCYAKSRSRDLDVGIGRTADVREHVQSDRVPRPRRPVGSRPLDRTPGSLDVIW